LEKKNRELEEKKDFIMKHRKTAPKDPFSERKPL
jgi:hypothetical protein